MIEGLKRSTLKWFGHNEKMGNNNYVQVYEIESEGPNQRGTLGRWKNREKEYFGERY